MWATIGTIASVIIGPLLAFFIARYWIRKTEEAAAEKRQQDEEKKHQEMSGELADQVRRDNESIDRQRDSLNDWFKNGASPPARAEDPTNGETR